MIFDFSKQEKCDKKKKKRKQKLIQIDSKSGTITISAESKLIEKQKPEGPKKWRSRIKRWYQRREVDFGGASIYSNVQLTRRNAVRLNCSATQFIRLNKARHDMCFFEIPSIYLRPDPTKDV